MEKRASRAPKARGFCRARLARFVFGPHGARSFSRQFMSSDPSEGVFFVLRLPKGWQLCTCRHDEYGPLGIPDFWVEALGSFLNIWIPHFLEADREQAAKHHAILERALGLIVAGYAYVWRKGGLEWR